MEQLTDSKQDQDHPAAVDFRFIPVRPCAIARAIAGDPERFGPVADRAMELYRAFDRIIEQEASALHEELDDLYAALNPDEETPRELLSLRAEERGEERLLGSLLYLLEKANFEELGQPDIDAAVQAGTTYGVRIRIDPSRVEHLRLLVRGHASEQLSRRSRVKPWRRLYIEAPLYRRLVVVTRLSGENGVRLKLFRDIPVRDVEALMPHADVRMSWFDQAQVFGAGAGAFGGLAAKGFTAASGGAVSLLSLASAAIVGLGGLAFRSFFGYRRTKRMRTGARTQHLYERNLANNAAVIHSLLRMIRQEEAKEALLAYAFMARSEEPPKTAQQLDEDIERWIESRFGHSIDFDGPDALETLDRLKLLQRSTDDDKADKSTHDADTFGTVHEPGRALDRLTHHWERALSSDYHIEVLSRSD